MCHFRTNQIRCFAGIVYVFWEVYKKGAYHVRFILLPLVRNADCFHRLLVEKAVRTACRRGGLQERFPVSKDEQNQANYRYRLHSFLRIGMCYKQQLRITGGTGMNRGAAGGKSGKSSSGKGKAGDGTSRWFVGRG